MKEMIKDKLYSFDEKIRVELGPQIIELDCNRANLSDQVTAPHYRVGGVDAYGVPITQDLVSQSGTKMSCVDWKGKHTSHVWKVYQLQETSDLDKDGKPIFKFIKVNEFQDKDAAINFAQTLEG